MRLGKKKDKDKEAEIKIVDGITRLICLSKGQAQLKGNFEHFFYTFGIISLVRILGAKCVASQLLLHQNSNSENNATSNTLQHILFV